MEAMRFRSRRQKARRICIQRAFLPQNQRESGQRGEALGQTRELPAGGVLVQHALGDAAHQLGLDQRHRGLIHRSDVYRELPVGTELRGFVRAVRHDHRLDVALTRRGLDGITDAQDVITRALERAGGFLPLHDRSSPEEIERELGMSKKAFKRAVGGLYKARRVAIEDRGIRIVEP